MEKDNNNKQGKKNKWSKVQKFCYNRNCVCTGCYYEHLISGARCQVRKSIRKMIEIHGLPKDIETKGVLEDET